MTESAISIRGVSKQYRIGVRRRPSTFREALVNVAASPFRRLRSFGQASHREEDSIWALKDVSFEVAPGEVVGIIGRNGAGKSTLLKILSQITYPTEGEVEIRGRVGSLLEVGTGFHPELTGRENVFLNGAILGMRHEEVKSRFDEIIDFSGIEKFIDTPVKRYSSGMYVRLAFSVAAHLEPEIMLVDEVLAVGDAQFRRKCIERMNAVSKSGRTVLFVSHNMTAVEALCPKTVLLDGGTVADIGPTRMIIDKYLSATSEVSGDVDLSEHEGRPKGRLPVLNQLKIMDTNGNPLSHVRLGQDVIFEVNGKTDSELRGADLGIRINKLGGQRVTTCHTRFQCGEVINLDGEFTLRCKLKGCRLMQGSYAITLALRSATALIDQIDDLAFEVSPSDVYGTGREMPTHTGVWVPDVEWEILS